MAGTLEDVIRDMESGVFDFTKDGKCIGCGQCCSALLPISEKELKRLHRYAEKKHIKPVYSIERASARLDLTCPFLDTTKVNNKCMVYPYRPEICRKFKCDLPKKQIDKNKEEFHGKYKVVYLWDEFYPDKEKR